MNKLQATQVMIAFQVEGDREQDLVSLLQAIVQIALALWGFWQWLSRKWRQVRGFWQDAGQAAGAAAAEVRKLWILDVSFTFGVG